MAKFRSAFVTSFAFPDPETIAFTDKRVKAAKWTLEKCPSTGKLHVHYAIWCTAPVVFTTYQKWVQDPTANVQPLKNDQGSIQYTDKAESRVAGPWQQGKNEDMVTQGQRTDIQKFAKECETKSHKELITEHTEMYAKYTRLVDRVKMYCAPHRNLGHRCKVLVLWGPSSIGKTTAAYKLAEELCKEYGTDDFYVKTSNEKYWPGYDGHKIIIVEDFIPRKQEIELNEWLKILDGRRHQLRIMHGYAENYGEVFIFTSNMDPEQWWRGDEQYEPFQRRITEKLEFNVPEGTKVSILD